MLLDYCCRAPPSIDMHYSCRVWLDYVVYYLSRTLLKSTCSPNSVLTPPVLFSPIDWQQDEYSIRSPPGAFLGVLLLWYTCPHIHMRAYFHTITALLPAIDPFLDPTNQVRCLDISPKHTTRPTLQQCIQESSQQYISYSKQHEAPWSPTLVPGSLPSLSRNLL